jgi:hypothetical protein
MAKKKSQQNRKAPRAATPRMYSDGAPAQTSTPTARPGTTASAPAARPSTPATKPVTTGGRGTIPLEQQYAYVMGDLKRLGVTALGGFAFLIILGFIFR